MKKSSFIALGALLLALTACDNRPDIVGQWQGAIKDQIPQAAISNVTVNYSFQRNGAATAAYEFELGEALQPNGEVVSPYQINVSGTAMVQGKWQYVDREDDEVAIAYDMNSLQVNIDPDAVLLQENLLSGMQQPQVDSLKSVAMQKYSQIIASYIKSSPNVIWDDVKVKKPLLKFEIGKKEYVMQQVAATAAN